MNGHHALDCEHASFRKYRRSYSVSVTRSARYEVQLEYEQTGTERPERSMGAIYGRLAPSSMLPRKPGEWESFDVTLVWEER